MTVNSNTALDSLSDGKGLPPVLFQNPLGVSGKPLSFQRHEAVRLGSDPVGRISSTGSTPGEWRCAPLKQNETRARCSACEQRDNGPVPPH